MKLFLDNPLFTSNFKIRHTDKMFFIGSCFADTMSSYFQHRKFSLLQNPFGILYNPVSIANSIEHIASQRPYKTTEFYCQDKVFNSWHHHSNLSHSNARELVAELEKNNQQAFIFLQKANVAFVTLGTAWTFYHKEKEMVVANNHRAPAELFERRLLTIDEIKSSLEKVIRSLRNVNSNVKIIFTVSPVRHTRLGLAENNRSKARLLEAVHAMVEVQIDCNYFPSYEMMIDVLRDYRFFKKDLVHPNHLATDYLWNYLQEVLIEDKDHKLIEELYKLHLATKHRIRQSHTEVAQSFIQEQLSKIEKLESRYEYLDLSAERKYFERL